MLIKGNVVYRNRIVIMGDWGRITTHFVLSRQTKKDIFAPPYKNTLTLIFMNIKNKFGVIKFDAVDFGRDVTFLLLGET